MATSVVSQGRASWEAHSTRSGVKDWPKQICHGGVVKAEILPTQRQVSGICPCTHIARAHNLRSQNVAPVRTLVRAL